MQCSHYFHWKQDNTRTVLDPVKGPSTMRFFIAECWKCKQKDYYAIHCGDTIYIDSDHQPYTPFDENQHDYNFYPIKKIVENDSISHTPSWEIIEGCKYKLRIVTRY